MTLPDGWLTDEEADTLRRIARNMVVLELGAWKGRSTVALAEVATLVVSIDRHKPFTHFGDDIFDDTLGVYMDAVRGLPNVVPVVGEFAVAELFRPDAFDLVFVDGVHDWENVVADLALAAKFDCWVALHDWGRYEVQPAAASLGMEPAHVFGSLAVFE